MADTLCKCGHALSRHDPEDGSCDAPAETGIGVCQCGRSAGFKHIMKDGESRLESLGDAVVFYLWERIPRGDWLERQWGFELFAQTKDGITPTAFIVQVTTKPDFTSIPAQKIETFKDLDAASQWVNDQVSQKMGWGYRTVRTPAPGNGVAQKQ